MNDTPAAEAAATAAPAVATPAAQTATEIQAVTETPAPAPQPAAPSLLQGPWMMILIMIALFYFMMIRPQQRKEKERRKMIDSLRAGVKVIFGGGMIGTIVEATEKTFIVETVSGRIEVLRNAVQGPVAEDGQSAK